MARAALAGLVVLCAAPFAGGGLGAAEAGASVAERVFFDRLRALVEARRWTDAARHIQQAQALRPPPAWLLERDGEVRLAQVRIGLAQSDLPATVKSARLFVNGDEARAKALLALASETRAAGNLPAALALVREITGRSPDFVPAQRALEEWEPKRERKTPAARNPAGATEDDASALLAQVRSAHAADDVPAMLAAARLVLNGDQARATQLLDLARSFFAGGDRAGAIRLVREVVRRMPDFPPAARQLAEFESAEKP